MRSTTKFVHYREVYSLTFVNYAMRLNFATNSLKFSLDAKFRVEGFAFPFDRPSVANYLSNVRVLLGEMTTPIHFLDKNFTRVYQAISIEGRKTKIN